MKITRQEQTNSIKKSTGINITYYLFDEYEIHYNEQPSGTTQDWHAHSKV